ncbi:MAG TPA: hypothetical protein VJ986_07365 [Gaiellaceae bacterium]|nr:hypothetical protein [Gaiellaceae bacterium]
MSAIPHAYAEMLHVIRFGGDPEDIVLRTFGTASVDGLAAMAQAGLRDPRFRRGMRVLIDHRHLDWRQMTTDDIRLRAERMASEDAPLLEGCRVAIVARGPAEFGVIRMLLTYAELDIDVDMEIFVTLEQARAWLDDHARGE